ncbi:Uncharacterized conserved protein [Klenkia marina]|uniref:Uncharacterized conserved protein n=1 Tax=Klenkia marina TaxID=1960309 RepID=A0A1G4YBE6_9ACTN|nr:hypothetical protein [Klenkia marina]SCX50665.1 Uncharacterized conserved protein [Klenkia marina]
MSPPGSTLVVVGVALLLLLAWVAFTLTRLRRLDGRVTRAWDVLDGALVRRADLAAAAVRERPADLGPAGAALAAAVEQTRRPPGGDREGAENALGRALRDVPVADPDLEDAGWRVGLARRFYNDAVRDTRALRRRPAVRVLRLHGRRPVPRFFDIDDGLDAVVGAGPTTAG